MIHIVPTLEDNYTYIIEDRDVVIIDCGDAAPVLNFLSSKNLTPTHILCTHNHHDHIDGLPELKAAFPSLQTYAPEKDLYRIPAAQSGLKDGDIFKFADFTLICIETRGHTQNHLCFYCPELKTLFSGDALFSMGCGRLFEGSPEDLFLSLQKLKSLPDETMIYCGHEYTVTNGEFCHAIEPHNHKIEERLAQARLLRAENKPTLPVSLRREKETNVFLRAETEEDVAKLREQRNSFR